MPKAESPAITVVGAGLVGSLLSALLARRGYRVEVYERRPDMRKESLHMSGTTGRSINLAVSVRGLHGLARVGLDGEVLRRAVPMRGRMMHAVDGTLTFQRYGKDDTECIHSVSRADLNKLLMTYAESAGNVAFRFNERVTAADLRAGKLVVQESGGASREITARTVIGTDGSASVIRDELMRSHERERKTSPKISPKISTERLDAGYKELTIPAGPGGTHAMEKNALHIWPRGTYMLIALPNLDGSFTCTLFLPLEGPLSFETLRGPAEVHALFAEQFPDTLQLIPDLEKTFFENPTGHMVTVKCEPWHFGDRALLLGDAAHAIVPFFGQGMNCGFEDCAIFDDLLGEGGSLESVFAAISRMRKTQADAIADMAVENFAEMRDKVADPRFLLEKGVERVLQEKFPGRYVSRYALVTFSREPYRFAYEMGLVQAEILGELCRGISSADEVNLERARALIDARLAPFFEKKGNSNGS